jgi:hypothetical protein
MSYIGKTPTSVPLTSSDITDGIITTTKIADANVTNPKLTSGSQQNFRNIIINGDMSIAQRSTSTSSANTQAYHCTDRWFNVGMTIGTWTISQSTDVPTGQGFAKSLKYDCTTAEASPGAGDQLHLSQRIEGQNLQYLKKGTANAESLTLSFWVKTNKTGTYQVNLRDKDNTRIIGQTYTVSLADTWEKKTITYAGDTTGALGNDNGDSLECEWFLGAGTNYTSGSVPTSWEAESATDRAAGLTVNLGDSTDNEWYITGVQLEAGTTASDFEFLPVDVNLTRCLRYCWKHGGEAGGQFLNAHAGYNDANYLAFGLVSPPVPMRVAPSLTENGTVIVHRLNTDYSGWTWGFITGVQSQSWFVSGNKTSHGVTAASSVVKCATTSDFILYSSEL